MGITESRHILENLVVGRTCDDIAAAEQEVAPAVSISKSNDAKEPEPISQLHQFPLELLLRLLSSYGLSARDLASCEATCRLFRQPVEVFDLLQEQIMPLAEASARQACFNEPHFIRVQGHWQGRIFQHCHSSWKQTWRYLHALVQTLSNSQGQLLACRDFSMVIDPQGQLFSFGCGADCRLANGSSDNVWAPTLVPLPHEGSSPPGGPRVYQVAAGPRHSALCTREGTVLTWGLDRQNCCGLRLGGEVDGEVDALVRIPTPVTALASRHIFEVAVGFDFTVVLSDGGEVLTFGNDSMGCLGHGDLQNGSLPRVVQTLLPENLPSAREANGTVFQKDQVVSIGAGDFHALAVSANGNLFSWGDGAHGKLGHATRITETRPRLVEALQVSKGGTHVVAAAGGLDISLALGADGKVFSWGWASSGRLGHGGYGDKLVPQAVEGLEHVRAVQIGTCAKRTFVVSDEGQVFTFGWRAKRLLTLSNFHIRQVSMGSGHVIALTSTGQILAYGAGERGQLGFRPDNESMTAVAPTPVPFGSLPAGTSDLVARRDAGFVHKPPLKPYRYSSIRTWGGAPGSRPPGGSPWNTPMY